MKVLHLTLKKKWFDLIASGEKKEEYREMKEYWFNRFAGAYLENDRVVPCYEYYDIVSFRNGYSKDAPLVTVEFKGMKSGEGKEEWGAEKGVRYFVIELGNILEKTNCKN